jgi:hypothetical protein
MEAPPHPMRLGDEEEDYYRLGPTFAAAQSNDVLGSMVREASPGGSGGSSPRAGTESGGDQ